MKCSRDTLDICHSISPISCLVDNCGSSYNTFETFSSQEAESHSRRSSAIPYPPSSRVGYANGNRLPRLTGWQPIIGTYLIQLDEASVVRITAIQIWRYLTQFSAELFLDFFITRTETAWLMG